MLPQFRSSMPWLRCLLLPSALVCLAALTLACSDAPPSDDAAATEAAAEDKTAEPQEPAQFRDGFETGDTSGWSGEGDGDAEADDSTTADTPPPGDG